MAWGTACARVHQGAVALYRVNFVLAFPLTPALARREREKSPVLNWQAARNWC